MLPVEFDAMILREGHAYVAYCPGLDVSSCGHTVDKSRRNLQTAVRLFLEEAEKLGTLEDILQEAGYRHDATGHLQSPQIVATEVMSVRASDACLA